MSALVTYAKCKSCNAEIEIPPLPVIVGETAIQKAARLGALEMATIMKHLTKAHPELRNHMIAWANIFSEFYFLAMFELEKCPLFLDQYDAQRILLLRLCQKVPPEQIPAGPDAESAVWATRHFYEENQRVVELEKAGYTITRGFLAAKSGIVV